MVVSLPPALLLWVVIHPFVGFWRRVGPAGETYNRKRHRCERHARRLGTLHVNDPLSAFLDST